MTRLLRWLRAASFRLFRWRDVNRFRSVEQSIRELRESRRNLEPEYRAQKAFLDKLAEVDPDSGKSTAMAKLEMIARRAHQQPVNTDWANNASMAAGEVRGLTVEVYYALSMVEQFEELEEQLASLQKDYEDELSVRGA